MKCTKILSALAAGLAFGSIIAAPFADSVTEAASESVLKLKSPAETYAAQGEKLYNEGKFKEAGEAYKKAAEEAKSNDDYWFLSGRSFFEAESYKTASGSFKKALKLKPNEGIYNYYYGLSLWNYAMAVRSGKSSGFLIPVSTDSLMDRGDEYVKRAAELMPDDVNVQMTAGNIAERYAKYLVRMRGYRSAINEEYQNAYRHFRRAAEIDSGKVANLNRFINEHSEYGFQPLARTRTAVRAGKSGARQVQSGAESNSPYVNDPNILKKEADQIQNWMNEGKIKAYNAGADFEWWDEKAKADFEALPFSDNIEEVASHVYRLTLDIKSPEEARYVVLVPRHVRVDRGGELEQFDSLTIVKIAERTVDYSTPDSKNRPVTLEPLTKMLDIFYIREGKTASIMHLGDHEYTWKWLEEGEKEVTEQSVGAMSTLASEVVYTFEGTADPNVIILNGVDDYDDSPVIGRLEVLPGVTTMLPPWYGE